MFSIFKRYKSRELFGFLFYKMFYKFLPINKNKVFFEAYWGKGYSCNPKAISLYLQKYYPEKEVIWSMNVPAMAPLSVKRYSITYFYHLATAKYFIVNANLPNFFVKKNGTKYIQTKHGTPLKLMGLDELKLKKSNSNEVNLFEKRCSNWDYVISSNPYSSNVWSKGFPYDYELLECGYPRNDILLNNRGDNGLIKRTKEKLGIFDKRKIVLYMPTIRDYPCKQSPYVDVESLATSICDDHVILSRYHYLVSNNLNRPSKNIVNVSDYQSVEDLYLIADVLITDYSSAMFDFSVLDKPIILFLADIDEYKIKRGFYFDIENNAPGLVIYSEKELANVISNKSYEITGELENKSKLFKANFSPWDDGNATEKICNKIFN